ncbi:alpha/beta hydrolase fold-domain-containing protein [Umbelopsis sp. PMI_123]|nr:alpha/beta hydrolase fold-domain-containing protein [Umbelopsis sp. PMI_123]
MEKQQLEQHAVINNPSPPKRTVRAILSATILTCACAYFFGTSIKLGDNQVLFDVGYKEGNFTWKKCYDKYECSTLSVPIDYSDSHSGKFDLALIRLKGTQDESKGPLFINPGGPGGSGVDMVRRAGDILSKSIDGYYDIIGFDPRGVGSSNTIRCFEDGTESKFFLANRYPILSPGDNPANHAAWLEAEAKQCIAKNKDFLPYVSTAAVARDIDSLRDAFGQEVTNYWGFSYGTFLGATYVNMFPDRVGRIILDGVTDPTTFSGELVNWIKTSLIHTEDGIDEFGASCEAAGPEKCALANRDKALAFDGEHYVAPTLRYYLNYLINNPLLLSNVSTPGVVSQAQVANTLFRSLYKVANWPLVAKAFDDAIQLSIGDKFHNYLAEKQSERCPLVEDYSMSFIPVLCIDGTHHDQPDLGSFLKGLEEASKVAPLAATLWGTSMLQCIYWDVKPAERYAGPWNQQTRNKVLLIGATGDPVTPVESAEKLEALMEGSGVFHKHHGWGHCSLGQPSKCTTKVIHDYFVHGKIPTPGSECPMETQPFESSASLQNFNNNGLSYQDLSNLADVVYSAQYRRW